MDFHQLLVLSLESVVISSLPPVAREEVGGYIYSWSIRGGQVGGARSSYRWASFECTISRSSHDTHCLLNLRPEFLIGAEDLQG
jgi:hypothetical protein